MSGNRSSAGCHFLEECLEQDFGSSASNAFILAKVFVSLPLCLVVVLLGRRRRRAAASHSDIFAYQAAILELAFVVGVAFMFCGRSTGSPGVKQAGMYVSSTVFTGQMLFHCLTCGERYLAVVHPVTYLGLRRGGGVRIRNASVGCVWLLCLGWVGVTHLHYPYLAYVPYFCILGFSLAVVSFCSLSVLCVLIRPGPGEVGGDRRRADQSKQRAFCTVTAIMAVLLVFFQGMLLTFVLARLLPLSCLERCMLLLLGNWCNFPSSLVLPLLFLHRAGKLPCCRGNNSSR